MGVRLVVPILLAGLLVSAPAEAQLRIGLLGVTLTEELEEADPAEFEAIIIRAFSEVGVQSLTTAEVARRSGMNAEQLLDCMTAECVSRLAASSDVNLVVSAEISGSLQIYTMTLEATSAGGRRLGQRDGSCDLCSRAEALVALQSTATALANELPTTGTCTLVVTPDTASITVNGEESRAGTLELPPGVANIVVSADGYQEERREVDIALGEELSVTIDLPRLDGDDNGGREPTSSRRLGGLGIAGVTLLGAGAIASGIGIGLLTLDDDCAGGERDTAGQCEFIYSTLAGSISSIAAGGAAMIAGVVLLILDVRRRRTREISDIALLRRLLAINTQGSW